MESVRNAATIGLGDKSPARHLNPQNQSMKIWPVLIQGSEEWHRARRGRVTASNAKRIQTPTGKDSSQWDDFAIELTAELICTDELPEFSGNRHTDKGNELEPAARAEFSRIMGLEVVTVGFVTHENDVVGFSPDGLILKPGMSMDNAVYNSEGAIINGLELFLAGLEIKCLMAKNHAKIVIEGGMPKDYAPQVQFSMFASGLPWYFISYCQGMRSHIVRNEHDKDTEKMRDAVERFVIFYGARRTEIMPLLVEENEEEDSVC